MRIFFKISHIKMYVADAEKHWPLNLTVLQLVKISLQRQQLPELGTHLLFPCPLSYWLLQTKVIFSDSEGKKEDHSHWANEKPCSTDQGYTTWKKTLSQLLVLGLLTISLPHFFGKGQRRALATCSRYIFYLPNCILI